MSQPTCAVCGKVIDGKEYDFKELERRRDTASPRVQATLMADMVIRRTGFQCPRCGAWLCQDEWKKAKGGVFGTACPQCGKNIGLLKRVILSLDVDALPEKIARELIEPDEHLLHYLDRGGNFEAVLTDQRLLYGQRPLSSVSLQDIVSVDIGWHGRPGYGTAAMLLALRGEDGCLTMDLGTGQAPPGEPKHELVGHGFDAYWRQRIEAIPRQICEAAGISFAIPKILPAEPFKDLHPKGTVIYFYPKVDLAWPETCAACLGPSPQSSPLRQTIHRGGWEAEYVTSPFDLAPKRRAAPPLDLKIPYCPKCMKERFGVFRSRPAVRLLGYDGLMVWLDLESADYARQFVEINSRPLGSPAS